MAFFTNLRQDIRYALRTLRRAPSFSVVAVLTLALGIGANAAVCSLYYQLLLRPLQVAEPRQLVNLISPGPRSGPTSCGSIGGCEAVFSFPMFRDLERVQTVFTGIAAHREVDVSLAHGGQTATGQGLFVSGSYFHVLGVRPALGRLLEPSDDRVVGEPAVTVLSHHYWQRQFGGRPDILNDRMVINGQRVTVIGVAPEGFNGTTAGLRPDVFIPITMRWRMASDPRSQPDNRRAYWLYLFARLKPGVAVEQARSAMDAAYRAIINDIEVPLQEGMSEPMMEQFRAKGLQLEPGSRGQSRFNQDARAPLTLLVAITVLVLLISCFNVANLLLARAAARAKELATRLAIGATPGRLVTQLMTETSVLAIISATVSFLVARWTMDLIRATLRDGPPEFPLRIDSFTLIGTAGLALAVTALVGLLPAVQMTRRAALLALKAQPGQPGVGHRSTRYRMILAASQMALSMVLVVLAGLFTKSLANLNRVDPGFRIDNLITFSLSPQRNGYTPERSALLFADLDEAISTLPGLSDVTSSTTPLLSDSVRLTQVFVEGFDAGPNADRDTRYDEIGPKYFRTLGVPLVSGREFVPTDSEKTARVAIVNQAFVRKFGLGPRAVGKRISRDTSGLDIEIVGVVRDFRHSNLGERPAPMYFVPHRQGTRRPGLMTFFVRTRSNPQGLLMALEETVRRRDPNLPIETLCTMRDTLRGATTRERLMSVISGAFAILSMLVASVGLYGVFAYTVTQRTTELGLRLALGATRGRVRWMVLRQVGLTAMIGGAIGILSALVVGRAAQALLFGLQFHDAAVLGLAVVVLMIVAFAAGFVPADRACRIEPIRALKHE
jgi:predicted permease